MPRPHVPAPHRTAPPGPPAWELKAKVFFDLDAERQRRIETYTRIVQHQLLVVGEEHPRGKQRPVVCLTKLGHGGFATYRSVSAAARALGISKPDQIVQAIKRFRDSAWLAGVCHGHLFAYADSPPPPNVRRRLLDAARNRN